MLICQFILLLRCVWTDFAELGMGVTGVIWTTVGDHWCPSFKAPAPAETTLIRAGSLHGTSGGLAGGSHPAGGTNRKAVEAQGERISASLACNSIGVGVPDTRSVSKWAT